jgi:membrane protease YdiL (CAAX protease family)
MPPEGRTTRRMFYLLAFLTFFVLGASAPALLGKLEGQGLAGSATVLLYGLLFSLVGIIGAYFTSLFVERRMLMRVNVVLLLLLTAMLLLLSYRYRQARLVITPHPVESAPVNPK